jgi:predicted nucleic acid-binding protein
LKNNYVLDTSAIIAYVVAELLEKAEQEYLNLFVSFVSFTEIFYLSIQRQNETKANERLQLLELMPIVRIESNTNISMIAGRLKALNKISFADAWIAALAIEKNAKLIHKDPEFETLKNQIELLKLPYK